MVRPPPPLTPDVGRGEALNGANDDTSKDYYRCSGNNLKQARHVIAQKQATTAPKKEK